ncbi:MAG: OmpA family protein [Bacteroidota bacterium]
MKRSLVQIFIFLVVALPFVAFSQTKKTFNDTFFQKGDIIRVPNLDIELLNSETDVKNDSLDALVNFINTHAGLKFELACHTDSRGNLTANQQSSQYRADGIKNYLVKQKNIAADRLKSKGYGKTKLLIPDGTIASAKTVEEKEKLHLVNRRIELIVQEGTSGTPAPKTPAPVAASNKKKKSISGNFTYGEKSQPLAGAKIDFLNEKNEVVKSTTTDALGGFTFSDVDPNKFYLANGGTSNLPPNTKVVITNKDGKQIQATSTGNKGEFTFAFMDDKAAIDLIDVDYHDLAFDLKGKAVKQDKSSLSNSTINLMNEKGEVVLVAKTDANGEFSFPNLRANQDDLYKMNSPGTNFINYEQLYIADSKGNIIKKVALDDEGEFSVDPKPEDPWLKVMNLKKDNKKESLTIVEKIYYNTGEFKLLPEAQMKLDKLCYIMKSDPQLMVELQSHTDSRAANDFNQKLSELRAKGAVDYIVSQGIAKERISGKGFGESQLMNKCADGVDCPEEEHAKNRRIEFKISRK